MNYRFSDMRFQELAENEAAMVRKYGATVTNNLPKRMDLILNVADSRELFDGAGRLHQLKNPRQQDFAFDLSGKYRLIIRFDDDRSTVVIIGIEDYH